MLIHSFFTLLSKTRQLNITVNYSLVIDTQKSPKKTHFSSHVMRLHFLSYIPLNYFHVSPLFYLIIIEYFKAF